MATYTVVVAKSATLVASTVDTVNVGGSNTVNVINRGSSDISFTVAVGGATASAPTALGDDCYVCPAGCSVTVDPDVGSVTQVKLISGGTPSYTVQVF